MRPRLTSAEGPGGQRTVRVHEGRVGTLETSCVGGGVVQVSLDQLHAECLDAFCQLSPSTSRPHVGCRRCPGYASLPRRPTCRAPRREPSQGRNPGCLRVRLIFAKNHTGHGEDYHFARCHCCACESKFGGYAVRKSMKDDGILNCGQQSYLRQRASVVD